MITTHDDVTLTPVLAKLRDAALAYPGAVEEFPWGDRVVKVRGKIFVFLNIHGGQLRVTTKLPQSGEVALMLPFVEPTGYGLGKSGWVTARFGPSDEISEAMLLEWIEESYRAVAPKRLAAGVAPGAPVKPGEKANRAAPAKTAGAAKKTPRATRAAPARPAVKSKRAAQAKPAGIAKKTPRATSAAPAKPAVKSKKTSR